MEKWTKEEKECLRKLSIEPVQRPPHKLVPLVEHFKASGSVRAVSKPGASPRVSKDLARKLRDLTQDGKLCWVLQRGEGSDANGDDERGLMDRRASRRDLVYQQAELNHISQVSATAANLEKQLSLPMPHDAGSWIPPRGDGYEIPCLWSGEKERNKRQWTWEVGQVEPGILQLSVEMEAVYFVSLKSHMPNSDIWQRFDEWKGRGAAYFLACRQLFENVVRECERRTGATVLGGSGWPQEGLSWRFGRQVYSNSTLIAEGYNGLDALAYDCRRDAGRGASGSQIWTLWSLADGLAASRDRELLEKWQETHETLLKGDHFGRPAKEAVTYYQALGDLARPIEEALRVEVERGTFDGGCCEFCP